MARWNTQSLVNFGRSRWWRYGARSGDARSRNHRQLAGRCWSLEKNFVLLAYLWLLIFTCRGGGRCCWICRIVTVITNATTNYQLSKMAYQFQKSEILFHAFPLGSDRKEKLQWEIWLCSHNRRQLAQASRVLDRHKSTTSALVLFIGTNTNRRLVYCDWHSSYSYRITWIV